MKQKNGFTFIEVVLVLAIAGLIFAMTFMALPRLWMNERDTERRNQVLMFIRNLKSYQSNNSRGALPGDNDEKKKIEDWGVVYVKGADAVAKRTSDTDNEKKKDEGKWIGFYRDYFSSDFQDPDGVAENFAVMRCNQTQVGTECGEPTSTGVAGAAGKLDTLYNGSFADNDYTIRIVESATCDGDHAVLSANARRVAALYRLEGSGVYCENT